MQMGCVPCIRGLRIPVATVVGMIASGIRPGGRASGRDRSSFKTVSVVAEFTLFGGSESVTIVTDPTGEDDDGSIVVPPTVDESLVHADNNVSAKTAAT